MNKSHFNPFLNRNKVTDLDEFYGRRKEVDYILEKVTYPEPQSVAIVGERRSGKSSILTYIYRALSSKSGESWDKVVGTIKNPENFVCILLDLEEVTTHSTEEFTWVVIDELISENKSLLKYDACVKSIYSQKTS